MRDSLMMTKLLDAGINQPFPVVASSEEELVRIINEWIDEHPSEDPPGSRTLRKQLCGYKYSYENELTYTATAEYVWVERLQITPRDMA